MNKLLSLLFVAAAATTVHAQPGPDQLPPGCCDQPTSVTPVAPVTTPAAPAIAATEPAGYQPSSAATASDDEGWHRPPGRRFLHGFRIGYTFVMNSDVPNREKDGMPVSIKEKYGLKTPHMMLLGYEGFYRIVGHSWLNVLMVGNVTVAGLEQSKFIPAASGLIGFELDQSFQIGIGVNVTPDPDAPTHAIFAAGWTPRVGSIHTPVHFFFVPEPSNGESKGNHRVGATVGVTW